MNRKPCKTAENHAPTVSKTMGVTVAKQQPETTTMTDNNADNDSTETTDKDDTPTVNGVELDRAAGIANSLAYQIEDDEIAADPETTPERNGEEIRDAWAKISNSDNDSTETTDKHATLTEYLSAADNIDDSIDGAAKITHVRNGAGVWQIDDGERLEDDPDEYRVECSCGEEFGSWGNAIRHAEEE